MDAFANTASSNSYSAETYGQTANSMLLDEASDNVPTLDADMWYVTLGYGTARYTFREGVTEDLVICTIRPDIYEGDTDYSMKPLTSSQAALGLDSKNEEVLSMYYKSGQYNTNGNATILFELEELQYYYGYCVVQNQYSSSTNPLRSDVAVSRFMTDGEAVDDGTGKDLIDDSEGSASNLFVSLLLLLFVML